MGECGSEVGEGIFEIGGAAVVEPESRVFLTHSALRFCGRFAPVRKQARSHDDSGPQANPVGYFDLVFVQDYRSPPPESQRHRMWITIGQKDTAESLGYAHGLLWETVWAAPENAELRNSKREGLVLNPGDRLFIPERCPDRKAVALDRRTKFRRVGVPSRIRLKLELNDVPEQGVPYVLEIDQQRIESWVPADGIIEHWVRPDQEDAVLWVGLGATRRRLVLKLRELRPLDTPAGVQNRLGNLGYPVTESGELDEQTRDMLRLFQQRNGLAETGEADEATLSVLKERHGP